MTTDANGYLTVTFKSVPYAFYFPGYNNFMFLNNTEIMFQSTSNASLKNASYSAGGTYRFYIRHNNYKVNYIIIY